MVTGVCQVVSRVLDSADADPLIGPMLSVDLGHQLAV